MAQPKVDPALVAQLAAMLGLTPAPSGDANATAATVARSIRPISKSKAKAQTTAAPKAPKAPITPDAWSSAGAATSKWGNPVVRYTRTLTNGRVITVTIPSSLVDAIRAGR